jgi:hypothetical protein
LDFSCRCAWAAVRVGIRRGRHSISLSILFRLGSEALGVILKDRFIQNLNYNSVPRFN